VYHGINAFEGKSAVGYVGHIHHLELVTKSSEFLFELADFVATSSSTLHEPRCSNKMEFQKRTLERDSQLPRAARLRVTPRSQRLRSPGVESELVQKLRVWVNTYKDGLSFLSGHVLFSNAFEAE
jgi:hypothetical protein